MAAAGKIDRFFFEKHVASATGAKRKDVIIGPAFGADFGLIDIGAGRALAVSTDPVWIEKSFGPDMGTWFAFHTIVGDVALSGLPPTHLSLDLNLPRGTSVAVTRTILRRMGMECSRLGMSVVTGHTGVYEGASFPTIGGGTAFAIGRMNDVIMPGGSKQGDAIVMTKGAGLETAVYLSYSMREGLEKLLSRREVTALRALLPSLTVVDDAITASRSGGVSSMHDASERGIVSALEEMSMLSGHEFIIRREDVPVHPAVSAMCRKLHIDPLECSSEGTLLITVPRRKSRALIETLGSCGTAAAVIGRVGGSGMAVLAENGGRPELLKQPAEDGMLRAMRLLDRH